MTYPEKLIESLIRHAKVVADGFDNPTARTRDNVRLLKKDLKKICELKTNDNDKSGK